jgi:hypothetical protein
MHRVVTKVMDTRNGVRKRLIDLGPWQPSEATAQRWAHYLQSTGRYDSVTIQSNGQGENAGAQALQSPEEDLFLEAGH